MMVSLLSFLCFNGSLLNGSVKCAEMLLSCVSGDIDLKTGTCKSDGVQYKSAYGVRCVRHKHI